MVISQILRTSALWSVEMSWLISSSLLQERTSRQGGIKWCHIMPSAIPTSPIAIDELGLSLPTKHAFNSLLASLSPRHTNAYLITRIDRWVPTEELMCANVSISSVSECQLLDWVPTDDCSTIIILCTVAKPFVWHREGEIGCLSIAPLLPMIGLPSDTWRTDKSKSTVSTSWTLHPPEW